MFVYDFEQYPVIKTLVCEFVDDYNLAGKRVIALFDLVEKVCKLAEFNADCAIRSANAVEAVDVCYAKLGLPVQPEDPVV